MYDIGIFRNFPADCNQIFHTQVMDFFMSGYPGKGFQLRKAAFEIIGHSFSRPVYFQP